MSGKAVGEWAQISGTTPPVVHGGSDSYPLSNYSGLAWREDASFTQACTMLAGGHSGNLANNAIHTIDFQVDVPLWTQRTTASDSTGWPSNGSGGNYFPSDNAPVPRHTYQRCQWSAVLGKYFAFGAFGVGSGANTYEKRDALDPSSWTWSAPGTYADCQPGGYYNIVDPATGNMYATQGSLLKWNPSTLTDSAVSFTGGASVNRYTSAFDTARNNIYHLSAGDSWVSTGLPIVSTQIALTGATTAITFNTSSAHDDFVANCGNFLCASLVYDADLDQFYFYNGYTGQTAKIYIIKPNGTTVWDMSLMAVTGLTPQESYGTTGAGAGGCNNKFHYISRWKVCVLVTPYTDVYFIRTQ